jgi:hypothetical protein
VPRCHGVSWLARRARPRSGIATSGLARGPPGRGAARHRDRHGGGRAVTLRLRVRPLAVTGRVWHSVTGETVTVTVEPWPGRWTRICQAAVGQLARLRAGGLPDLRENSSSMISGENLTQARSRARPLQTISVSPLNSASGPVTVGPHRSRSDSARLGLRPRIP